MAWFSTIRRWFGGGATAQGPGVQDFGPMQRVYQSAPAVGVDGAMQISAVWAAVELLADNIASLPLFVYEVKDGKKELARESDLYRLLHDSPNRRHTAMEFWQFMVMNYVLRGNAYARLVRNSENEVIELWPLSADQVEVEVLKDNSLVYKYRYDSNVAVYAASSILHFRDKGNGVVGMSRLEYMRSSLGVAIEAQNHTARIFAKDGRRPGVFMIDKTLTPAQRDLIRANFKSLVEGNDDDLLVLEAGAKFEPLGMTPADLQLLDTRRFSVEDIGRWLGIPSILINDLGNRVPYGNNNELIELFYKVRLRPMLVGFEQALRARVLTPGQRARYVAEFGMDALLRASLKDRMEIYAKAAQNGLKTRNECRQLENDPPLEGGELLTAQTNLVPLTMLGTVQGASDVPESTIAQ